MIKNLLKKALKPNLDEQQTVAAVLKTIGNQIYSGPFAGLKIPNLLLSKLKLAEILGFYEYALHKVFSNLLNQNIENIMVIGGHKGYYPAGLSNLLHPNNLTIFEMDKVFHPMIKSWFTENHLQNYQLLDEATNDILKNWQQPVDFLLIDCEGAEATLLNPKDFIWQKKALILVEIHHFYDNKILGNIIEEFKSTHTFELIYDDIYENEKIENILNGLGLKGSYRSQPWHRWIIENETKIITAGGFLYLKPKK
jgi:hypothetical protein